MSRFEAEATIGRSADAVWAYAADILQHPAWMSVADAHLLRGQGTEIGARGRERLVFGPIKRDVEFEVVVAEPGRRIVWRTVDDPRFEIEVGLELDAEGATVTHARYHGSIEMRGRWRLLAPLLAMDGSATIRRELGRLKSNIESAPAMAPATS